MTEDTSPENLRKFLESDDPAIVMKGLSMATEVSDDFLGLIAGLYARWNDQKRKLPRELAQVILQTKDLLN